MLTHLCGLYLFQKGKSVAMATSIDVMDDITPILKTCSFLDAIPETRYANVLNCLKSRRKQFQKDDTILNIGDHKQLAGVVLRGTAEISFLDEGGSQINVDHISAGKVFGAVLVCSQQETSPIRMRAITDCDILFLDFTVLLQNDMPPCPFRAQVASNLLRDFARQAQFLNQRLRIISQKRLRDKIKVCLQAQPMDASGTIRLPFKRNEWADFLYADRSALSRELSRMSEEGIISYQGKSIRILDPNFLKN